MPRTGRLDGRSGWMRAEHCALAIVASLLVLGHAREVAWDRFLAAFVLIDLVGYVPGAIAFRRAGGGPIAPVYHHLYNLAHSYLVAGAAVGLWALAAGGPEWAMLAVPIHLSGDRGIIGNFPGGRLWPAFRTSTRIAPAKPAHDRRKGTSFPSEPHLGGGLPPAPSPCHPQAIAPAKPAREQDPDGPRARVST